MVLGRHSREDLIGETRNVSSCGIFFVAPDALELGSLLDFKITLSDIGPVRLACKGKLVRVERQDETLVGMAATIDRYEFLRELPH